MAGPSPGPQAPGLYAPTGRVGAARVGWFVFSGRAGEKRGCAQLNLHLWSSWGRSLCTSHTKCDVQQSLTPLPFSFPVPPLPGSSLEGFYSNIALRGRKERSEIREAEHSDFPHVPWVCDIHWSLSWPQLLGGGPPGLVWEFSGADRRPQGAASLESELPMGTVRDYGRDEGSTDSQSSLSAFCAPGDVQFNTPNNPTRSMLSLFPFCQWRHWVTERSRIAQWTQGRAGEF